MLSWERALNLKSSEPKFKPLMDLIIYHSISSSFRLSWRGLRDAFYAFVEQRNPSAKQRQPNEWEKFLANDMTNKELISNIYKQLIQFDIKKTNNLILKWAEELNSYFLQWGNADGQRCLTLLNIREMQTKTTVRYHLTPVRMASITNNTNNKC